MTRPKRNAAWQAGYAEARYQAQRIARLYADEMGSMGVDAYQRACAVHDVDAHPENWAEVVLYTQRTGYARCEDLALEIADTITAMRPPSENVLIAQIAAAFRTNADDDLVDGESSNGL